MNDLTHIDLPEIGPRGIPMRLCFGGGGKGPNATEIRKERERAAKQEQKFMRQIQQNSQKEFHIPTPPKPPPGISQSSADVQDAEQEKRRQAAKRQGLKATLIAGETGGYAGESPMGGQKTLLG